jgi:hypothetical protein
MTLTASGISYDVVGGSSILKIHPANWLFAVAFLTNLLGQDRPLEYLNRLPGQFPGASLFCAMWLVTIAFEALVQHGPVAPLVDTFFAAMAMLVIYDGVTGPTRQMMQLLIHIIMFTNACVGIFEFLTHTRLTPFVVAGTPILHDSRSTALLGHPLLNAGTTAAYVLTLFYGGEPSGRPLLKLGLIGVQLSALVAFGGRAAIVLVVIFLGLRLLPQLAGFLSGRPFDRRNALLVALGLPLITAAIFFAASRGLFTDFLERFVEDKGSTQARLVALELFDAFSFEDLLLGPDPGRLASLQQTLGIEYGIENSWLGFIFQYGALIAMLFAVGLFALFAEIASRARQNSLFLFIFFVLLVSASASISVKSFALNQFAILIIVLFERTGTAPLPAGPFTDRERFGYDAHRWT